MPTAAGVMLILPRLHRTNLLPQELAEAAGVQLDEAGFEASMAAQRARSSASRETLDLTAAGSGLGQLAGQLKGGTRFEGYTDDRLALGGCTVVGLLQEGQTVEVVSGQGGCDKKRGSAGCPEFECTLQPLPGTISTPRTASFSCVLHYPWYPGCATNPVLVRVASLHSTLQLAQHTPHPAHYAYVLLCLP